MDALAQNLERTRKQLEQFIQQVKAELDSKNATLREYERFFEKCETLLPTFHEFVNQMFDGLKNAAPKVAEVPHSSPRVPRAVTPKPGNQTVKNVLVVDDAEINRVLMGHYFKALPIKIEFSNCGRDAIQKCQSKKFDLILMDLQMKDMDGLETTQQIRSFEKATPIFAITNAEPNPNEEQRALGAGCNRYLSKGISKESLQDQVSEVLF